MQLLSAATHIRTTLRWLCAHWHAFDALLTWLVRTWLNARVRVARV
jgi:hypothetical protein